MSVYKVNDLAELVKSNEYPGRGIVMGCSEDGTKAVIAYFIMGRSANSRNRIFAKKDGAIFTVPFDASKVEDPSLIMYAAVRRFENKLIVTNGDQTDTVYEGLKAGKSFSEALQERCFEPDIPNLTPRISGLMDFSKSELSYEMSILKSADEKGSACSRYTYSYAALPGLGHFIHTYQGDGVPLPTFCGEPERVKICNDIDDFTGKLWSALNEENKISLYVNYKDIKSGMAEERLINKNV